MQAIFTAVVIILVLTPLAFLARHIVGPMRDACLRRKNKASVSTSSVAAAAASGFGTTTRDELVDPTQHMQHMQHVMQDSHTHSQRLQFSAGRLVRADSDVLL